ncbi:MAG: AI-2E family transporter [Herminiimonas sp.]|nr:AI-2E family transporter [Herminiimonas sp.]
MNHPELQHKAFLILLVAISAAFLFVVSPFAGAIFWAVVLAIVFEPLHARLLRSMGARRTLAALATLLACVVMVILPLTLIAGTLVQQGTALYKKVNGGQFDAGLYFEQAVGRLPSWLVNLLDRAGMADLATLQTTVSEAAAQGSRFLAVQAVSIGQNTFDFVVGLGIMLYLLFFMLRDGKILTARIREALPMSRANTDYLLDKFTTVIRATFRGNVIVAAVQGTLGGLLFWFLGINAALLWGVLMALLSLLPAIGAALIWGPVALTMLTTGEVGTGALIVAFGVLVIGLVDNLLRPMLVGKDTRLPDYMVLVSTVGGMALFGLSGFVIGPMVAALFLASWAIFMARRGDLDGDDGVQAPAEQRHT